mmetsp:Transcript_46517/g.74360  ORF Transcript_46517/g.74360 Transcript_46517/m.74360 type:complete len:256 (+) Transcript_46517:341-1108(+)
MAATSSPTARPTGPAAAKLTPAAVANSAAAEADAVDRSDSVASVAGFVLSVTGASVSVAGGFVSAAMVRGLNAVTFADTTKSSAPLPGIQSFMNSRLSAFSSTRTSWNPAATSMSTRSCVTGAPATQHDNAAAVRRCSGSTAVDTTSVTASRPPGLSTRSASRRTRGLSGERLMTQFEMTTSIVLSPAGRFSISPRRNSTRGGTRPLSRAFSRALASMSGVMSTPTTDPAGPTSSVARRQSIPAPHPKSRTNSPG